MPNYKKIYDIPKEDLIKYRNQRFSQRKIAKIYGCEHHVIRHRLIEYGLSTKLPPVAIGDKRKKEAAYQRRHRQKLRRQIIERFGGKCVWCGFNDWRALQFDHINNDGYHERSLMGTKKYMKILRDDPILELKKKYQLLCSNCNWIKRYEYRENK